MILIRRRYLNGKLIPITRANLGGAVGDHNAVKIEILNLPKDKTWYIVFDTGHKYRFAGEFSLPYELTSKVRTNNLRYRLDYEGEQYPERKPWQDSLLMNPSLIIIKQNGDMPTYSGEDLPDKYLQGADTNA